MNDVPAENPKQKKFRSPPYPMFDLKKAVERAKALHTKAQHYQVGIDVLAEAWGMKSGDGKVWRAAAALIQYGLLTDSGTGQTRKFQLTDIAKRIVLDENLESPRRKDALRAAALSPMIHKELWGKFQTTNGLADSLIKSHLTLYRAEVGEESPYSPAAAVDVLNTYRASIAYAGVTDSDTVSAPSEVKIDGGAIDGGHSVPATVKVGNFVKWTSGGVDQFTARKVEWISDDGTHLRVIGNPTGIPMNEIEKVENIATPPAATAAPVDQPAPNSAKENVGGEAGKGAKGGAKIENVTTSVVGGRLQISADVSADEIDALKDMLTKYQEILKLMN